MPSTATAVEGRVTRNGKRRTGQTTSTTSTSSTASSSTAPPIKMTTEPLKIKRATIQGEVFDLEEENVNQQQQPQGKTTTTTIRNDNDKESSMMRSSSPPRSSSRQHPRRQNNSSKIVDKSTTHLGDLSQYSQSNPDRTDNNVAFFVIPEGFTTLTCRPSLPIIFRYAKNAELVCEWMSEKDCLARDPVVGNIFVMDPFSGPAYERLLPYQKNHKCFLIGPQVLRFLISDEPNTSTELDLGRPTPALTVGMRNLLLTTTGTGQTRKKDLSRKISLMFGTETKSLTKGVTHVVTDSVMTEKVFVAYESNIMVMKTEWVDAVWEDSQNEIVHATNEKYAKYSCPIFHNMIICVSQVSNKLKEALRKTIEANGGQYSAELMRNKTNLLIVPKPEGDKYRHAKQWNLPCVVPEWIEACKVAGYVKNPKLFAVDLIDVQMDPPSTSGNKNNNNKKKPDIIMNSTPIHSMLHPFGDNIGNESIYSNIGSCPINEIPTGLGNKNDTIRTENVLKKATELLNNIPQNGCDVLDGCQVYISKNLKCEDVRKLVNASGATRLSGINDKITHIIAPLDNQFQASELQQIKQLEIRPYIVKLEWLTESVEKGTICDIELFQVNIDSPSTSNTMPNNNNTEMVMNTIYHGSSMSSHSSRISIGELVEKARSGGKISLPSSSVSVSLVNRNGKSSTSSAKSCSVGKMDVNNVNMKDCSQEILLEMDLNLQLAHDEDCPSGKGKKMFSNRLFKIAIDDKDERDEVEKLLVENGGKFSQNNYDIVIVQPIYEPEEIVPPRPEATVRTKQWVNDCVENETMDIEIFYYHSPLALFRGMLDVLPNVVIATSQYSASEKDYLCVLVTAMGGLVQDVFARKTCSNGQKTTHLICSKTDSPKYRAAKKWGTPVVVAEWIIDSFKAHTCQPIENYDPATRSDSQSNVNYIPKTPVTASSTKTVQLNGRNKIATIEQKQQFIETPERNNEASPFKTPASRKPSLNNNNKSSTDVSSNLNENESFLEYYRQNGTPDLNEHASFQEWLKQQPKTPTVPPEDLSPIIGGDLGFTRQDSRRLKYAMQHTILDFPTESGCIPLFQDGVITISGRPEYNLPKPINQIVAAEVLPMPSRISSRTSTKRASDSPPEPEEPIIPTRSSNVLHKRQRISSSSESGRENERITRQTTSTTTEQPQTSIEENNKSSSTSIHSSEDDEQVVVESVAKTSSSDGDHHDDSSSSDSDDTQNSREGKPVKRSLHKLKSLLEEDDDGISNGFHKPIPIKPRVIIPKHEEEAPTAEELDQPAVVWVLDDDDDNQEPGPSNNGTRSSTEQKALSSVSETSTDHRTRSSIFCIDVPSNPKPIFILSGASETERNAIKQKLSGLGGVVSDLGKFDSSAFALIASSLTKSEKILCGIASGKPLLSSKYLEKCVEANKLLPITEDFLYTEEDCKTTCEKCIAKAALSWIHRIHSDPLDKPFREMAFFINSASKKDSYERLILAGGGVISEFQNQATIILTTLSPTPKEIDGIPAEPMTYIFNHILGYPLQSS